VIYSTTAAAKTRAARKPKAAAKSTAARKAKAAAARTSTVGTGKSTNVVAPTATAAGKSTTPAALVSASQIDATIALSQGSLNALFDSSSESDPSSPNQQYRVRSVHLCVPAPVVLAAAAVVFAASAASFISSSSPDSTACATSAFSPTNMSTPSGLTKAVRDECISSETRNKYTSSSKGIKKWIRGEHALTRSDGDSKGFLCR